MSSSIIETKSLKLEILPEGQELIRETVELTTGKKLEDQNLTGSDLAIIVGDALMYYKILLEHKSKGGEVILKNNDQQVKLPVIASIKE